LLPELYQKRKIRDVCIPYIVFIGVLGLHEIPALVILYMANSNQPVYFGSLRYSLYDLGVPNYIVYLGFLIFEVQMAFAVVLNALFYGFLFIMICQSSLFWIQELT
jgi:hypothetical protein